MTPGAAGHEVRVGCSGWNYAHWRARFYPQGLPPRRWLAHYAGRFDTVELNASFYRLPTRTAAAAWAAATPPGFLFAVKASRYLTHIRRLRRAGDGLRLLYERIEPLAEAGKLGPILWQLPENFHRDDDRLSAALGEVRTDLRHAFEFRDPSWFADEVLDRLRSQGAALVIGDHPRRRWQPVTLTADFTLIRFHYGRRGRDGNYSDRELDEWAETIARLAGAADVYAYFNNDWPTGTPPYPAAIRNARRLLRRLGRAGVPAIPSG